MILKFQLTRIETGDLCHVLLRYALNIIAEREFNNWRSYESEDTVAYNYLNSFLIILRPDIEDRETIRVPGSRTVNRLNDSDELVH